MFSVRIVSTDHYMSTPVPGLDVQYADQRGAGVKKVPVVRIFGSTPAGQKTCLHVHGVFPYLYIPYDGTIPLDRYLRQFASSLDKAINVAQGHGQSNIQHVYKIVLVAGRSMYGYHYKEQQFLKIYLYNPSMVKKAADLLLGGAVLNKPFQPHESHIPYTLQLFIDYNLYGMNMINVAAVKFRRHSEHVGEEVIPLSQGSDEGFGSEPRTPVSFTGLLNRSGSMTPSQRLWQNENIPSELYLDGSVERLSTCELEADVVAADILNRLEVGANIGANPGLAALWEDERQRRRDRGESTEIAPPDSQERVDINVAESEMILRERLQQILLDLQPYMDSQSDTESEQSQDLDFPLTQASDLDLHVSPDEMKGSQDTVMLDAEEMEEDRPIVDVESIQRVVSFSQSFCDVRPEVPKVSSQDKSLVDILASLAEDASPPSSQNAAAEVVALEEQDSILSQLSQPKDEQLEEADEKEILEMSQRIWENDEKKGDDEEEFDLAGMDDTWIDSQIDSSDKPAADEEDAVGDDSDSDAASDILPQYDGPPDEKGDSKRTEAKQAILKRLGMRGPISNLPLSNRNEFDSGGNMVATNPFADSPSTGQNFSGYAGNQIQRFPSSGNWNPNWSRNMPSQNIGRVPHSPGAVTSPQQFSPVIYQHSNSLPGSRNQFSPMNNQSGMPGFPMSPGRQNQYIDQSFSQGSPQHQLSPGSYQTQYHGSQAFSPSVSQQISPPYTAPPLHHAQTHSSQSDIQYSPPVTFSASQKQRPDLNRFLPGNSGQFPHSTGSFSQPGHGLQIPSFSRPEQMSAPTSVMSVGHQLQSQDHTRTNQNQPQNTSQGYRMKTAFSCDSNAIGLYHGNKTGVNSAQPIVSNLQRFTAQPTSAMSSSQSPNQLEEMCGAKYKNSNLTRRSNPSDLSNKVGAVMLEQGTSDASIGRGQHIGTQHALHSSSQHSSQFALPDCNREVNNPLSQTLAHHQKFSSTGDYSSPNASHRNGSGLNLGPFGKEMDCGGSVYGNTTASSPAQQLSPRTPTGDPGLQSPGSAGLKQSDPFVGPVTKYFQRKLMYEQISPPVTPVSTSVNETGRKSQSISSPSSGISEHQISPLHRLLLDKSDLPKPEQRRRSPSSSLSSLSSVASETLNQSQQDISHPSRNNQEKSKLFSLLSSVRSDDESKRNARNLSSHSQNSQNDSQQDLFADSFLSDMGSVENTTTDSLTSLFSDDLQMNSQSQQQNIKPPEACQSKQGAPSKTSNDNFASLSNLESFVGSVRNESAEFGVNFNKTSASKLSCDVGFANRNIKNTQQGITSDMPVASCEADFNTVRSDCQGSIGTISSSNNLTNSGHGRMPQTLQQNQGQGMVSQNSQGAGPPVVHQSPTRSYNLTDWPQYQIQTNIPKPGRGGGQRRRGRPPLKKGLSYPVETFGIVQKKRRGRPKKSGDNFTLHSTFQQQGNFSAQGSQYSPHLHNQYPMPPHVNIPPSVNMSQNMNMNMPYFPNEPASQSQSFSQLLEGDSSDLLAEFTDNTRAVPSQGAQFGESSEMFLSVQSSRNQFQDNVSLNQDILPAGKKYPDSVNLSRENFNTEVNLSHNHENQSAENLRSCQPAGVLPGLQDQQYMFHQQQPEQNFLQEHPENPQELQTISLTEAMQISDPNTSYTPDLHNFGSDDLSQVFSELPSGQTCGIDPPVNCPFQNEEQNTPTTNLSRRMSMQAWKRRHHLKQNGFSNKTPRDAESIMELMRYRQHTSSAPKTSVAYKFRFRVPTPVFKRLKFRVKRSSNENESSQLDFVRMHPKDARKYSLLKIGREIIELKRLSEDVLDEIQGKLKLGKYVEGIPPPVRQVLVANTPQTCSIIADLLSADSPPNNEMIRTGDVEVELNRPFSGNINGPDDTFMVKKERKLPLSTDKKVVSMFRGRSIANIPHLKKYRAGFPYFGKGNVGRGGSHAKVKVNNKNLKPEYEDDENIVLKDVCLNEASDGILTPIKSRTPVAGRSPAHCSGGVNLQDIESQEKTILESKLKDLEYDLDLNQSGNSQMFQDVLIGEKDLQQKAEFENADEDLNNRDEREKVKVERCKLEKQNSNIIDNSTDCNSAIHAEKELIEVKSEDIVEDDIECNGDTLKSSSGEAHESILSCKTDLEENSLNDKVISIPDNHDAEDSFGNFKKCLEGQLSNGINGHRTISNVRINAYDEPDGARRSRSSSTESQLMSSQRSSRRNSVVLSGMSGDDEKCFWPVGSVKRNQSSDGSDCYNSDTKKVKIYKSSANGSSSAGSRKSSRSSSLDQDKRRKRSKSKKKQKKSYRYDSDSDGIPGVDYIVVNRFKGRKELRVVVDKLKIDHQSNDDSETKRNRFSSVLNMEDQSKDDIKHQDSENNLKANAATSKPHSGFSAEFEKFVANQSNPVKVSPGSDSDTEDFVFPESLKQNNGIETSVKIRSGTAISESDLGANIGSKIDVTEEILTVKEGRGIDGMKDNTDDTATNSGIQRGTFLKEDSRRKKNGEIFKGLQDFCSSSEEDQIQKKLQFGQQNSSKKQGKLDGKKKKNCKSIHDGSVFCSKARKKRPKPKLRPSKLMCNLSALHDATLEKLTSSQVFSDFETCNSSSSQSPAKSRDISDIDSPVRWQPRVKTPDFELYLDRTDDHVSQYEDTMFKLAYLSPMSTYSITDSPPQPLSPKEIRKLDGTVEQSFEKISEHNEKKMTMSDILKTMQAETEMSKETEASNVKTVETPGTPNKIAVAKTEALTLKDIKSLCLNEKGSEEKELKSGNEERVDKRIDSPPPDLGPPVLESENEKPEDGSPPPQLSPRRNESEIDSETYMMKGADFFNKKGISNAPPFLTPCRSPRISLSPRYASPRCTQATDGTEAGGYFSLPIGGDSINRAGRSPGTCSSSGSINVIHSEEFSDISDDNESDADNGLRRRNRLGKPRYVNSPTMPNLSPRGSLGKRYSTSRNSDADEKERKRREIEVFEERLRKADEEKLDNQEKHKTEQKSCFKKADENRNNIFELLSIRPQMPLNCIIDQDQTEINKCSGIDADSVMSCVKERVRNGFSGEMVDMQKTSVRNSHGNGKKLNLDLLRMGNGKKYLQNKNLFPEASPNHVTYNNQGRNCEIEVDKHNNHNTNGILHHSLSQNDFMQHFSHFINSKTYQDMSMDLNRAALERTSPFHGNLSSQKNLFEKLNLSGPSSRQSERQSEMGIYSGDLFESTSETSSHHSFPHFSRSLSDNGRSEYSFIRNEKLNDSIMRSVQNYANRGKSNATTYPNIPFLELGCGQGIKRQKGSATPQNTRTSVSGQNSVSSSFRNEGNLNDSLGNRDHDKNLGHEPFQGSSEGTGCQVITPHNGPPSLESILESSSQHGLAAHRPTGAFYSNCGDVPEKPREGGGHVLKLPSTLVKELEEFDSSSLPSSSTSSSTSPFSTSVTGIRNWRTILCAKDSLMLSQTGSSELLERLDKEPALKYAITGDQSVIISPCILPPSKKSVEKWNKERKVYQDWKIKAVQKSDLKERKNEKSEGKKIVASENEKLTTHPNNVNQPSTELKDGSEFTVIMERRQMDTKAKTEKGEKAKTKELVENVKSPVSASDHFCTTQSPSATQDEDSTLLHSTPVLRRGSTELFEPECTPISGEKRHLDTQGDQGPDFVTPKRIKPLRRLSTNTESTLRRTILSTQIKQQFGTPALQRRDTSQIEGPSLKNSFGFKHSQQNLQDAKALHEYQYLTVLSIEVHVETRGDLKPDPEVDGMKAIFYSIFNDVHPDRGTRNQTGVFIVDPHSANENSENISSTNQKAPTVNIRPPSPQPGPSNAPDTPREQKSKVMPSTSKSADTGSEVTVPWKKTLLQKSGIPGLTVTYVKDEEELLQTFIDFVHRWNPDILVGYEIQMLSWGYVLQRASTLSVNLAHAISRIPSAKGSSHISKEQDEYGADHMSEIHIAGRIVLNLWRLLRHEVTLNVYSFENVAFHVLHRRIPLFPFRILTAWFKHRTHVHRWKVIEHYVTRVKANLEIMDQLDIVGRTSEFARVFGIEFYHVLSRGSQYRVESMMLRVAKPMNYIPVSPSVHQRARMKAPECIPLTLEPESRFYTDPVVVVDFQSLYPSIMIAYNYCFSTCLGRVEWFQKAHEGPIEFGCTSLSLEPSVIRKLSDEVTISPNGVVFCKQSVKRGVLPVMVEEILNTRLMVKKAMSSYKDDKTLSRMLNARQLGLKLIANVTYGYTGANYSGRMPCIEVGDSIVRKARETLERSIKLIEDTPRWGARVVYGDTDSMFIELKGRSKDEAFKIGQDIAKSVTAMFPKPIKLKFEKVYLPCVLQTKKRYVGFMYETPDQKEPVYDAKGIETVRRDTCSAVSKILERSLKVLFTTKDVSEVKAYIQQQCQKVMEGSVSLQDFVFAKEYRGMAGYKPGACVPALEIAKKNLRQDRRSEPRVGERVPYVIVYGSPGLPLIQLVRTPAEVLQDPSLRLNATYYITKQILPPLDRFLSLMGASVFSWYQEMPHSAGRVVSHTAGHEQAKKGTISQYFATSNCPTCDSQTKQPICQQCIRDPQLVCMTLNDRITRWERVSHHIQQICGTCTGTSDPATVNACSTLDCPVRYRRSRASSDMTKAQTYRDILEKIFK